MEVAYNLRVPCQIVLSNGKENVMDEINLKINKNALITVCVSDVLDPTQFKTKEEWFDFVKEEWKKTYDKLEKNETDGKKFFGPLPGITEESIVDEQLPSHRRRVAISCTVAVVAVIASLIVLIRSLTHSFVCSKQSMLQTEFISKPFFTLFHFLHSFLFIILLYDLPKSFQSIFLYLTQYLNTNLPLSIVLFPLSLQDLH